MTAPFLSSSISHPSVTPVVCIFRICPESRPCHHLYYSDSVPRHHLRPGSWQWPPPQPSCSSPYPFTMYSLHCGQREAFSQEKWDHVSAPQLSSGSFQGTSLSDPSPHLTSYCPGPCSLCSNQTSLLPISPTCQASSRLRLLHWSFLPLPETLFSQMSTCLTLTSFKSSAQVTPSP